VLIIYDKLNVCFAKNRLRFKRSSGFEEFIEMMIAFETK
jgi:hypothetical protein